MWFLFLIKKPYSNQLDTGSFHFQIPYLLEIHFLDFNTASEIVKVAFVSRTLIFLFKSEIMAPSAAAKRNYWIVISKFE